MFLIYEHSDWYTFDNIYKLNEPPYKKDIKPESGLLRYLNLLGYQRWDQVDQVKQSQKDWWRAEDIWSLS